MADNVQANQVTTSGPIFCSLELTFSGDTVKVPGCFLGIASGSEGSWTYTAYVGGAGAVTAGTQRMTLASDDPAVTALQLIDDTVYVDDADWTDNTSKHVLVGGVYQSSPHTVTDGDVTPFLTDANGRLAVTIGGTVALPTGASTLAEQQTQTAHLATIAGDTTDIETAVELIDDTVFTDDAAFTPGSSKVLMIGAQFDNAATDSVDEGDAGAVRMSANRNLYVNIRDNAGNERGLNIDASGFLTANINGTVTVGSHAVTNAGTFAVQVDGASLTALQLIDDPVVVIGTATYSEGTSKGNAVAAVRRDADTSLVNTDNEFAPLIVDARGFLKVECFSGETLPVSGTVAATQSGTWNVVCTNAGTFAVQVSSLPASTNTIEVVGDAAHDAAVAGNPVLVGLYASAAAPSDVSGDGDAVRGWALRNGAQAIQPTFAGILAVAGNGASGTGVQRVTIANDSTGVLATLATLTTLVGASITHDGVDSGNPHKIGMKAIAHGANPTAVAAADRTDLYANRHGIPFVIGGHMNVITRTARITDANGAQTDASIIGTISAGSKVVVTSLMVTADGDNSDDIRVKVGFGAATLPADASGGADGILCDHPGVPAGGGFTRGDGSGILGIGADGEEVRLTCDDPVGGFVTITFSYYLIES